MTRASRFLLMLCLLTSQANAEPSVLFVTENLPPLQYQENGVLRGEHALLVQQIIAKSGIQNSTIEVYPWARAYKMATERKNTFIFSIVRTPERENKFIWVKELGIDAFGFYGKQPTSQYSINVVEDAKQWLTVVLRQDLVFETLTSLGFKERRHLIVSSNLNSVFKVFFSGKADLVVTNKHLFKSKAELLNVDMKEWGLVWTIPELTQGYFLAANPETDPEIVAKISSVDLSELVSAMQD